MKSTLIPFLLAEEIKNASETLPRALLWGVGLNIVLGYVAVFTLCFTVTDPTRLIESETGYPMIQLFYDVTKSKAGTDIMSAIIIITLVSAVISEIATASRQIWSFARDRGLPFSNQLAKVSTSVIFPEAPLTQIYRSLRAGTSPSMLSQLIWALASSSLSSTWDQPLPLTPSLR